MGSEDARVPAAARWLYLSGLSAKALYRKEEWLGEFVQRADASRILFRWHAASMLVVAAILGGVFVLASVPLGLGFFLCSGSVLVVATRRWAPKAIEAHRTFFASDALPFVPPRWWRFLAEPFTRQTK